MNRWQRVVLGWALLLGGSACAREAVPGGIQEVLGTATLRPVASASPAMVAPEEVPPDELPLPSPIATTAPAAADYYIAYVIETESGVELVIADPTGGGKRGHVVPGLEDSSRLGMWNLSPGGDYLAYHTGESSVSGGGLVLRVLRLEDDMEIAAIPLTTDDVISRMESLGDRLAQDPPLTSVVEGWTASDFSEAGLEAMAYGLHAMDWSPDGKLVAFAGQIDGATSDVYTFGVASRKIQRLTDGPTQVQYVDWSPDGKWIAHGSTYWVGPGAYMINNFVTQDGAEVVSMDIGGQWGNEWYGSDWFVTNNGAHGVGSYGLMAISPANGEYRTLWKWPFAAFLLDIDSGVLVISQEVEWGEGDAYHEPGTYTVDLKTGATQRVGPALSWMEEWPREGELGLMWSDEGEWTAVNSQGEMRVLLVNETGSPVPSPDGERIAFYEYMDSLPMRIWEADGGRVTMVGDPVRGCSAWRPDGEGILYAVEGMLHFNALDGEPSVIVDDRYDAGCGAGWIRGSSAAR